MENKEQKKDKKKLLLILLLLLLLLITVSAVGVTVWALFYRTPDVVLTPDYAPQQTEENAESIPGDSGDKLEQPEGGGAVSMTYSNQVVIDLSDEAASLLFANPGKSNQDMVVQIVIQDVIIVQSGRLTPGNQVTKLTLLDGMSSKLAPGGYEGKFVVLYYDQTTGEKAVVNTEIPINITVNE